MMNFNEYFSSASSSLFSSLYLCSLDVCYMRTDGATIKSISENIVVNPGDEAKLSCAVDGEFWSLVIRARSAATFFLFLLSSFHFILCFDGFCFAQVFTGLIIVMENSLVFIFSTLGGIVKWYSDGSAFRSIRRSHKTFLDDKKITKQIMTYGECS